VPYVRAILHLPAFNRRIVIQFLIDTGADATTIHPQDSLRLLAPAEIKALGGAIPFGGAGAGKSHHPSESELIFMRTNGTLEAIALRVYIAEPGAHNMRLESLLGRDVLDRFVMMFDQNQRTVVLGA